MAKVFVSYARDELKKVNRILNRLKEHRIEFWIDTRNIENGKDWAEEIARAIKNCSRVLLFMSRSSMASPNIAREVKIAFGGNKKFAVLRLDEVKYPTRLKYALEGIQWTDYLSDDWESKIVSSLGGGARDGEGMKPLPARPSRRAPLTRVRSPLNKKMIPRALLLELERAFSVHGTYHKDQCSAALVRLGEIHGMVSRHWVNPSFAYDEMVPRLFLLEKIELIRSLTQDFQESCPPGSPAKRQLLYKELKDLIQEFDREAGK